MYESAEVRRNPATAARERKRWKWTQSPHLYQRLLTVITGLMVGWGSIYRTLGQTKAKLLCQEPGFIQTLSGKIPDVSQTFPNQISFKNARTKIKTITHSPKSPPQILKTSSAHFWPRHGGVLVRSVSDINAGLLFFSLKNDNKNFRFKKCSYRPLRSGNVSRFCESLHFLHTQAGFACFPYFGQTTPFKNSSTSSRL